jgi:hypothetical protein
MLHYLNNHRDWVETLKRLESHTQVTMIGINKPVPLFYSRSCVIFPD